MKKLLIIITVVAIILGLRSCMSDSKDEKAAKDAVVTFCDSIRNKDLDKFIDVVCLGDDSFSLRKAIDAGDPTGIKRTEISKYQEYISTLYNFEKEVQVLNTTCEETKAIVTVCSCGNPDRHESHRPDYRFVVRKVGNQWLFPSSKEDLIYSLQAADKIPAARAEMALIAEKESKNAIEEGAWIVKTIEDANSKREKQGKPLLWPTPETETYANTDKGIDIAQKTYKSTVRYFKDLLDFENREKAIWKPYVAMDAAITLFNNEANFLEDRYQDESEFPDKWRIVAGDLDNLPDWFPRLISANVNIRVFDFKAGKYDLRENKLPIQLVNRRVELKRRGTAYEGEEWEKLTPERKKFFWQYDYLIVVRKNGKAERIPKESCTMSALFPEPFRIVEEIKCLGF